MKRFFSSVFVANAYKLGEHVELGARFYTSWSQEQEEFHLMGLFNIGFSF